MSTLLRKGDPQRLPRSLIDWSVAAATGARLVGTGPSVTPSDARQAVGQLLELARTAEHYVRDVTGMASGLPLDEAVVVDRPTWVRSAAAGMDTMTRRAMASVPRSKRAKTGRVFAGTAGVQTGLALAFLGSKVLGQYDPFGDSASPGAPTPSASGSAGHGKLRLVAPNIVQAERALDVSPDDFRMWVCLHECTHRVQFTGVDWLAAYFVDEVGRFLAGMDETAANAARNLPAVIREARGGSWTPMDLVAAMQAPAQREAFDRLIALTTVLEGHADYVMDAVGPSVVPSLETLRTRFTERRKGGGLLDRLLRSLLGVDAKIKQYEQGGAFTRHVVAEAGMNGFNAVWRSPNTLPSRAELADPDAWLRRVKP